MSCQFFILMVFLLNVFTVPSLRDEGPDELKNGQEVHLSGRLVMKGYNWNRFFVLQIAKPHKIMFDKEDGGPTDSSQIGFYLSGQTAAVEKHVGEEITVEGKLQLNQTSPYYWEGTMIQAHSVNLGSDTKLLSKPEAQDQSWPDGPDRFIAIITMLPNRMEPQYSTLKENVISKAAPRGFGCGVNGGGDMLNCRCPEGYTGSHTGKIKNGQFIALQSDTVLQPVIGENAKRSVTVAAECIRDRSSK